MRTQTGDSVCAREIVRVSLNLFLFVCVRDLYLMSHRADCPADVVIVVALKFQRWLDAWQHETCDYWRTVTR